MEQIQSPIQSLLTLRVNQALGTNYQSDDLNFSVPFNIGETETQVSVTAKAADDSLKVAILYSRRDLSEDIPLQLRYFPISVTMETAELESTIFTTYRERCGLELTSADVTIHTEHENIVLGQIYLEANPGSYAVVGGVVLVCGLDSGEPTPETPTLATYSYLAMGDRYVDVTDDFQTTYRAAEDNGPAPYSTERVQVDALANGQVVVVQTLMHGSNIHYSNDQGMTWKMKQKPGFIAQSQYTQCVAWRGALYIQMQETEYAPSSNPYSANNLYRLDIVNDEPVLTNVLVDNKTASIHADGDRLVVVLTTGGGRWTTDLVNWTYISGFEYDTTITDGVAYTFRGDWDLPLTGLKMMSQPYTEGTTITTTTFTIPEGVVTPLYDSLRINASLVTREGHALVVLQDSFNGEVRTRLAVLPAGATVATVIALPNEVKSGRLVYDRNADKVIYSGVKSATAAVTDSNTFVMSTSDPLTWTAAKTGIFEMTLAYPPSITAVSAAPAVNPLPLPAYPTYQSELLQLPTLESVVNDINGCRGSGGKFYLAGESVGLKASADASAVYGTVHRFNSDGSIDPSFAPVDNSWNIYSMVEHEGYLYVYAISANGAHVRSIRRFSLDGTYDSTWLPAQLTTEYYAPKIVAVGGYVYAYGPALPAPYAARISIATGTVDTGFVPSTVDDPFRYDPKLITVLDDGNLLVLGFNKARRVQPDGVILAENVLYQAGGGFAVQAYETKNGIALIGYGIQVGGGLENRTAVIVDRSLNLVHDFTDRVMTDTTNYNSEGRTFIALTDEGDIIHTGVNLLKDGVRESVYTIVNGVFRPWSLLRTNYGVKSTVGPKGCFPVDGGILLYGTWWGADLGGKWRQHPYRARGIFGIALPQS